MKRRVWLVWTQIMRITSGGECVDALSVEVWKEKWREVKFISDSKSRRVVHRISKQEAFVAAVGGRR